MITAAFANRVGTFTAFAAVTWATGIIVLTSWYLATTNAEIIVFSALYGLASSGFQAIVSCRAPNVLLKSLTLPSRLQQWRE